MSIFYKIATPVIGAFMLASAACNGPPAGTLYNSEKPIRAYGTSAQYDVERYVVQGPRREITARDSRGNRIWLVDADGDDRLTSPGDIVRLTQYGSELQCEGSRAIQVLEGGRQRNMYDFANNDALTNSVKERCDELRASEDRNLAALRADFEAKLARK